ncbi:MAG: porin family protein [Bacteroidales bacterium]
MLTKSLFCKALYTLLGVLFLSSASLNAQNGLVLKGGANYNYLGYDFEEGYGDRFGYTAGLAGLFTVSPSFIISPELAFSRRSIELFTPVYLDGNPSFIDTDVRLGLNYVDVPLHFGYGYLPGSEGAPEASLLLFYAGPQLSFLTSQKNQLLVNNNKIDLGEFDEIRNTLIALNLGISAGIKGFYADLRYSLPVNSLLKGDHRGDGLTTMAITIGYSFIF